MGCAIWCHLYNSKNVKNTYGRVLLLVKLQAERATLLKVSLIHGCFSRFLNCTHGTKSRNASHSEFTFVSFLLMKVCLITIYNNESQVSLFKHLALIFPSRHLFVQNQQYKHQSNVSNMFKVNNKDTRTISMTSFWCLYCCL